MADLERKAADERSKAARERNDALRIQGSISGSTSRSILTSKLREIQRRQERAVDHDKRAARHADDAARKGQQLTTAKGSLDRAAEREQKKDDAELRRRRDDELRHLDRLEAARREASAVPPPGLAVHPSAQVASPGAYEFDVCLSFAGEDRAYVEMVSQGLKHAQVRVFYDEDEHARLWGKDLAEHFDYIYRQASQYCVMFVSAAYAAKKWTRHERRSALARAIEEESEYILPARFDDTQLPGLLPTLGYIDLRKYAPETVVEFLLEKLGHRAGSSNDS